MAMMVNNPILPTISAASFNCNRKNRNAYNTNNNPNIVAAIRLFLLNPKINDVIKIIVADAEII